MIHLQFVVIHQHLKCLFSFVHFHDPKFRIIRGASCSYMEIEKRKQKRTRRQSCSKVEMVDENRGYGYADDLGRRNLLELLEGNMTEMHMHGMCVHSYEQ